MVAERLFTICRPRFLLISLGNPAPYAETLHSAGHIALKNLPAIIPSQPAFQKTDLFGQSCEASIGEKYSLVQCPTLMNISGGFTLKAWRKELARQEEPVILHLVVVHDDLEEDLGVVKRRRWQSSHRGHNGIKSIITKFKDTDFPGAIGTRISIGIGRPQERDQETVSDYVLRPLEFNETMVLENAAPGRVLKGLNEWEKQLGF